MAHKWEDHRPENCHPLGGPWRICVNCGAVQQRERQTWYMRTTGYIWYPPAGRCKPKDKKG